MIPQKPAPSFKRKKKRSKVTPEQRYTANAMWTNLLKYDADEFVLFGVMWAYSIATACSERIEGYLQ